MYAKPNLCDPDTVVKYISRYLGRPVIATSRIDSYDGENVTFHYNKHEDNSYVEKTVPVLGFIMLLIQHIPEKHFKLTRYYGLYARHRESDQKLSKAVPKSKQKILLDFKTWRNNILLSFGYDPLCCPKCKYKMEFLELYYNHERVSLCGNITPRRIVKHFDYDFLRIAFRKVLLERMAKHIGPSFKKMKNEMYTSHSDDFYV